MGCTPARAKSTLAHTGALPSVESKVAQPLHSLHTHTHPQALCEATGRKEAVVKKSYEEAGDLGAVAAAARNSQKLLFKPKPLSLAGVFKGGRVSEGCSQGRGGAAV